MLQYFLLILGVILIALALFDRFMGKGQWISLLFFSYGFIHLLAALFLFLTPGAPYGSIVNETITNTYANFTTNTTGIIGFVPAVTNTTTTYAYNNYGAPVVLALWWADGLLFFLFMFFFMLNFLIAALTGALGGGKKNKEY